MALDEAALEREWPRTISVDNGTEFRSNALDDWALLRCVKKDNTQH